MSSPRFMMPSTSSDVSTWINRSHPDSDQPSLPPLVDPSTNPEYRLQRDNCFVIFDKFSEDEQTNFVNEALRRMTPNQHSYVYSHLKAILQRDFITLLPKKGLDHVAEKILCYLDANSLCAAELVCTEWLHVISEGMLWKKLIERKVQTDLLWKGLAERRNWIQYLFKPKPGKIVYRHLQIFFRGGVAAVSTFMTVRVMYWSDCCQEHRDRFGYRFYSIGGIWGVFKSCVGCLC